MVKPNPEDARLRTMTTVHLPTSMVTSSVGLLLKNPNKDDRDLAGTAEKPNCNRRHLAFSSQETPPAAAFTEPQIAEVPNIISPNTLKKAVCEQNSIPLQ